MTASALSATALPACFSLRAPWPDELPRLRGLFHLSRLGAAAHLRILLREGPERIVGGFALLAPSSGDRPGLLLLRIRPAYIATPAHEALLESAHEVAREAGLSSLATRIDPDAPERGFLLAHGASHVKTERFYEGDLLVAHRRLHPMLARLPASTGDLTVRPLAPADHPVLAAMAASHGLLNANRAAASLQTDYDQDQSLVCTDASRGDAIVGAMLVQSTARAQIYVEARMVHPDHTTRSGPINMLLITLACERWLEAGFTKFTLSCDPAKDVETVNFAHRMRCNLATERHTFHWSLAERP